MASSSPNISQHLPSPMSSPSKTSSTNNIEIREVWHDNLDEEFALISSLIDSHPFVAMDTEFPGIVCRPVGTFKSTSDFHYQTLKSNVSLLKLIQLGLTFSDYLGNIAAAWQFNFREFDPRRDLSAPDSIDLLRHSGIDFDQNSRRGIDANRFAELLIASGVVLNDNIHWITFHSAYDFGYLLKALTCRNLPETQSGFFDLIRLFFPTVYDIKHLMKFCNSLHGGLNKLAELIDVKRIGVSHQAGSDSLLTLCAFRKLRDDYFDGCAERYAGVLYGLGGEIEINA